MGRLKKEAKKAGKKLPQYVASKLTEATIDVTLTSEEYKAIAEATEKAERTGKRCATEFPN